MNEERAQYGEPINAGNTPTTKIDASAVQAKDPTRIVMPDLPAYLRDLRAENERLRAALRPFAREADDWEESTDDDFYPAIGESGDGAWSTAPATFTVGDLRRARAALNHAAPAAEQEGE